MKLQNFRLWLCRSLSRELKINFSVYLPEEFISHCKVLELKDLISIANLKLKHTLKLYFNNHLNLMHLHCIN